MNHADRLGVIIRDIEIGLETGNDDEIELAVQQLEMIREEILAADELNA